MPRVRFVSSSRMLVIFDCDGVLVDSERIVNRVESDFLTSRGWTVSPSEARALFKGRAFEDIVAIIDEHLPGGFSEAGVYELAMTTALAFQENLTAVQGVSNVLNELRRRGVPMCVASQSALSRVRLSLRICGLDSFFGTNVFTASMVSRPKPAPDLFLHAARAFDVPPEACVVIEDSPSGVQAGVAAGMRVLGYAADETAGALREAGATTFTQMLDALRLLEIS